MTDPKPTHPTRRDLLRVALTGGAGCILGWSWWQRPAQGQEGGGRPNPEGDAAQQVVSRALEAMQAHQSYGVAIVVPEGAEARAQLAEQLGALIPGTDLHGVLPEAAMPWLEAVWVCAPAALVEAQEGETLVLLDPEGGRVAGACVDLSDPAAFLTGARALLDDDGREDARCDRAATQELAQAAARLAETGGMAGFEVLREAFPRSGPLLMRVYRGTEAESEAYWRVGQQLNHMYFQQLQRAETLPFGVEWDVDVYEPEPCPPCGMAAPSIQGRTFLRFFAG